MLLVRHGDLLRHVEAGHLIVHGCNAQNKMAAGFAEALSRRYPLNRMAYIAGGKKERYQLGEVLFTKQSDDVHIANAITQQYYGRDKSVTYVDYHAVRKALKQAIQYARVQNLEVHMPFIGAGYANGDMETLMCIFHEVFEDFDATLWIKE